MVWLWLEEGGPLEALQPFQYQGDTSGHHPGSLLWSSVTPELGTTWPCKGEGRFAPIPSSVAIHWGSSRNTGICSDGSPSCPGALDLTLRPCFCLSFLCLSCSGQLHSGADVGDFYAYAFEWLLVQVLPGTSVFLPAMRGTAGMDKGKTTSAFSLFAAHVPVVRALPQVAMIKLGLPASPVLWQEKSQWRDKGITMETTNVGRVPGDKVRSSLRQTLESPLPV